MNDRRQYCPVCAMPLVTRSLADIDRLVCGDDECGFVFWDNPIPVVAGVVEHEGRLVFARNIHWPEGMYGLVTGFLEPREEPSDAVVREVAEELGLTARITEFIGVYGFARKNQILLAYHLVGDGEITFPDGELAEAFHVDKDKAEFWPGGTGLAVRDWLRRQGHDPQPRTLPPEVEAWLKRPPDLD